MTSGPVLATVWEGHGVVAALRTLMGDKTQPDESAAGSVRCEPPQHCTPCHMLQRDIMALHFPPCSWEGLCLGSLTYPGALVRV